MVKQVGYFPGQALGVPLGGGDGGLAGFFHHLLGDAAHALLNQFGGVTGLRHLLLAVLDQVEQLAEDAGPSLKCPAAYHPPLSNHCNTSMDYI